MVQNGRPHPLNVDFAQVANNDGFRSAAPAPRRSDSTIISSSFERHIKARGGTAHN